VRPAANRHASGPWEFIGKPPNRFLTDRTSFTTTTDSDNVVIQLDDKDFATLVPDESDTIRATILVIDDDLPTRPRKIDYGFALGEFQLLYAVVKGFGPIPVFRGGVAPANPDAATCPTGRIRLDS
jgi:hypothetical protein